MKHQNSSHWILFHLKKKNAWWQLWEEIQLGVPDFRLISVWKHIVNWFPSPNNWLNQEGLQHLKWFTLWTDNFLVYVMSWRNAAIWFHTIQTAFVYALWFSVSFCGAEAKLLHWWAIKNIVHLHERGRHSWKVNHAETLNTCTRTLNLKTSMSSRSGCVCNPRCSWDSTSRWTPRTLPLMARASSEAWATSSVKTILGPPVWVLFGINSPIISRGLSPAQHYSLSVLINTILEFKARKEASSWGWWQAEHWETIGPVSAPSCVAWRWLQSVWQEWLKS